MKKLIKEPLLHFFVLGALLFAIYSLVNKNTDEEEIIIDNSDIEHMIELWQMQWQRPPSEDELQDLINKYVDQEVMYREALRLNLDHNDEIVKRRLAQKMEFLGNDLTTLVAPATDKNLKAYFEKHKENYATDYNYTLHQVIFTADNHKNPVAKANNVLDTYDVSSSESLKEVGDKFPLPYTYSNVDAFYLNRELDENFTKQLSSLRIGEWSGPIMSGFGVHLIYIEKKDNPRIPEFASVKKQVQRDYEYQMVLDSKNAILKELKQKYKINIEADNISSMLKQELAQNASK
ncbi:peptidyl-prolyl cis-trans isomerase [Aestuariibaculum marinum]|uniref:peptidylprolyl isomerase n=1 Tax=Aestuariibaculum marinum TaxID=2683592 RepID=A0A8J6Q4S4_9FLAO|nr:peptidylprolyl isomerase [Aestuariibaculum marinum]MBD0824912.1 peptidyl-prolyl cis-trans isomerase [Aestuariibaculum marinum]